MLPPMPTREEREREILGYSIAANVRHMATLNSQISALQGNFQRLRATLQKRRQDTPLHIPLNTQPSKPDAVSPATPPAAAATVPSPEPTGTGTLSATTPPVDEEEEEEAEEEEDADPPPLPTHNRGGQVLRWSLAKAPQLSRKLGDDQRAENAIFTGRMNGESKQARRRRIRRELDIMRSWDEEEVVVVGGVGGVS